MLAREDKRLSTAIAVADLALSGVHHVEACYFAPQICYIFQQATQSGSDLSCNPYIYSSNNIKNILYYDSLNYRRIQEL